MKRLKIKKLKVGDYVKVIGTNGRWKDIYWIGKVLKVNALIPDMTVFETNDEDTNHCTIGIIESDIIYLLSKDEAMIHSL
jgi:hypothetical protein